MKPKPPHADEIMIAVEIAKATEFAAFMRVGPHEKFAIRGFPDYEAARRAADEIEAKHSRFGRKAIVYAITQMGSFPCDDRMIALARI